MADAQTEKAPASAPGRANPRLVALHRSVRAAIVNPSIFAITLLVFRDLQVATFAVFGCFALLVMADFGGRRPARAVAYVSATIAGAALIALGTWVSANAAVGSVVMLAVGFTVAFAGVFGGYLAAAQSALLLAFVLAVAIPGPVSAIPARMAGWLLAGAASTLAGLFLWPWFERIALRKHAADACLAVADLIVALRRLNSTEDQLNPLQAAARTAVQSMRSEYARTAMRPAGPTRRDRAFVELMTELEQIVDLTERPFYEQRPSSRPCIDEGDQLTEAVTAALRASAAALTGGAGPDIAAIEIARREHRAALDRWAGDELRRGRPPEEVLQGIDVDHTLRVAAYLAIALSANAVISAGGRPPEDGIALPASIPQLEGPRGTAIRVARTLRTHLDPSSTVLHGSLRTAVGLALSVFLARTLGLSHAFWVVLGTLTVLRSNALGTGRTTVEAMLGSVIGFVAGGLFAVLAGNDTVLMWIAMPIAIFLASYAASAIGFVAGQAAFTVTVIIIFNLISPAGWQVGLVRIEDVAIGTAISVVVGVLLWPRGARRDVSRATSSLYRAVIEYLHDAFDAVLGVETAATVAPVRAAVLRARLRAGEAFDVFLNERGAKRLEPATVGRLVAAGRQALLAGDLLLYIATDLGYRATSCPEGAAAVREQVGVLLTGLTHLADELAGDGADAVPLERPSLDALNLAALTCMRDAGNDGGSTSGAMAVVIAGEWVENLGRLTADLEQPVAAAVGAAEIHWWR
ncbi:MAG TPA: FUSC family protein [Candidatus Dormibacteraeota bacterium]|jgi:uncharacterized membrane protein YccC